MSEPASVGTIRSWEPEKLEGAAEAMERQSEELTAIDADELNKAAPPDDWAGPASDSTNKNHATLRDDTKDLADELKSASEMTRDFAVRVQTLKDDMTQLEGAARERSFSIGNDGEVVDELTRVGPDHDPAERELERTAISRRVTDLEGRAAGIDKEFSSFLEATAEEDSGVGSGVGGGPLNQ